MVVIPKSLKKKSEQEQKNKQQKPKNTQKTTTKTASTPTYDKNAYKRRETNKQATTLNNTGATSFNIPQTVPTVLEQAKPEIKRGIIPVQIDEKQELENKIKKNEERIITIASGMRGNDQTKVNEINNIKAKNARLRDEIKRIDNPTEYYDNKAHQPGQSEARQYDKVIATYLPYIYTLEKNIDYYNQNKTAQFRLEDGSIKTGAELAREAQAEYDKAKNTVADLQKNRDYYKNLTPKEQTELRQSRIWQQNAKKVKEQETAEVEKVKNITAKYGLDFNSFSYSDMLDWAKQHGYGIDQEGQIFARWGKNAPTKTEKEEFKLLNWYATNKAYDEMSQGTTGQKVFASLESIGANIYGGVGQFQQIVKSAFTGDDIDLNTDAARNSLLGSRIRENVAKDMSGKGAFLYQTGMSIADNLALLPMAAIPGVGEGLILGTMGSIAAAQKANQLTMQGKSGIEAAQMGLIAGAIEAVTENIGLDNLMDLATKGSKKALIGLLKQAGAEGMEEGLSDILNFAFDQIAYGDNSEYNQKILAYENGEITGEKMSREDAEKLAFSDFATDLGMSVLGGALSGLVFGLGGTAINAGRTAYAGSQIVNQGGGIGTIDEGLGFGIKTDAYQNAQKLAQKIGNNKNVSNYSIGKQAILNSQQNEETLRRNIADDLKVYGVTDTENLTEAMTSLLTGEKISGKQAEIIAKSKEAVKLLEIYTGEDIEADTSISELKAQIKSIDTSQLIPSLFEISPQQRISDFAETLGDNGKTILTKFYDGSQNAEEYVREMNDIYNAGRNNAEIPITNTVNSAQAQAMYQAGQVDTGKVSGYNVNNQNNNVEGAENYANTRGQDIRHGGERNGSSNTQRQVSEVESSTRRNAQNRQTDIRSEGSGITTQEIHEVTAKTLSIKGGDSRNSVNLETDYEGREEVERIAKRQGLKVVAFSGNNLSFTINGEEFEARGAIDGGTMYIRTDSKEVSAVQIAKHEATHDKIRKGQINLARVKEKAYDASQGKIELLERAYASAFNGLTADEIWEEIVCDSVANMNLFEYTYGRYSEKTGMLNQMVRDYAWESEKETGKETQGVPEGAKFSRNISGILSQNEFSEFYRSIGEKERGMWFPKINDKFIFETENKLIISNGNYVSPTIDAIVTFDDMTPEEIEFGKELFWNAAKEGKTGSECCEIIRNLLPKGNVTATTFGNYETDWGKENNSGKRKSSGGNHSNTTKFSLVSPETDAEYLNAVKNGDMETAQKMVDEAAKAWGAIIDENGNAMVVYHGTDAKFTVFDRTKGRSGMDIQGMFFSPWEIDAGGYGKNIGKYYISLKNPANEAVAYKALNIFKGQNYAGTKARDYLIRLGYDGVNNSDEEYIAFYPEQIKSADAVTYDDNGNVIPLSKRFSDSEDIRFSRVASTYEEIRQESEDLRKELAETKARLNAKTAQAEYWKGETRETAPNERTVVQKSVKKVASDYIKDYNISAKYMSREEIEKGLTEMAEFIFRSDTETDTSYDTLINKAYVLASDMIDSCETINSEKEERYRDIKGYFKDTTIRIPNKDDIIDYNAFRKRMLGKMNLSLENGTPIEKVWTELGDMYGQDLFPDDITNPTDQILHAASVLNDLSDIYENPHEQYMDMVKEELAIDVVNKILTGIIEEKVTISDRRRAEYSDRIERLKRTLKQVRERRDENYAELQNSFKEYRKNVKGKQLNKQLLHIMKRLNNKKLPAPNRAVQEEYAAEINRAIGEFNLSVENVTPQREARMYEIAQRVAELQDEYPEYQPDNATRKWLDAKGKKTVSELSIDEKRDLIGILLSLEHDIDTYNKFLGISEWQSTHEAGLQVMRDVRNAQGGFKNATEAKVVLGVLRPDAAIKKMVGYNHDNPLYQAFLNYQNGETEMIRYGIEASAMFERFNGKDKAYPQYKGFYNKISGEKAEHITIVGTEFTGKDDTRTATGRQIKVDITPAMRMSIYMHSLNRQNLRHMTEGGVEIYDINSKEYKNGRLREAPHKRIVLSLPEIRRIKASMTAEERAYCHVMQEYFDTMSKPRINEVALKLFGVEKANVDNYFPISVVNSFRFEDLGAVQRDGSVTGMGGRLNERIDSTKPIYLLDADDVLKQSIMLHSRFVGLSIPYRDINKLWNVQDTGLKESELPSALHKNSKSVAYIDNIKETMSNKWTVSANDYMDDLMRIYNQGVSDRSGWDKIFSNYQQARIAKNLAVSMKQAASFPTAAAEVGNKAVLRALAYATTHFPTKSIENQQALLQNTRYQYRLGKNTMDYGKIDVDVVQLVDTWTVAHLLPAAEFYVKEHYSDLAVGTDEYNAKVQEVFDNIIMKTQPNYTPLQRPAFLRSKNPITRAINIFKTQPYQNLNILYDAVGEYRVAKKEYNYYKNSPDAEAVKKAEQRYNTAKTRLGWAITSQISASFVYALMQYLLDLMRSKKKPNTLKKYKDKDGKMDVWSVSKGLLKNMFTNAGGMLPLGTEAVNIFKSGTDAVAKSLGKKPIFDEYTYDLEMPIFSMLNSFSGDITKVFTTTPEIIGDIVKGDDIDWLKVKKVYGNAIISALELKSGTPIKNITNFADTIISWFKPQKDTKKKKK